MKKPHSAMFCWMGLFVCDCFFYLEENLQGKFSIEGLARSDGWVS